MTPALEIWFYHPTLAARFAQPDLDNSSVLTLQPYSLLWVEVSINGVGEDDEHNFFVHFVGSPAPPNVA